MYSCYIKLSSTSKLPSRSCSILRRNSQTNDGDISVGVMTTYAKTPLDSSSITRQQGGAYLSRRLAPRKLFKKFRPMHYHSF